MQQKFAELKYYKYRTSNSEICRAHCICEIPMMVGDKFIKDAKICILKELLIIIKIRISKDVLCGFPSWTC